MPSTQRRRLRIIRWGSIVVLLLVMLPMITYVGHWDPFGVQPAHAHSLHHETNDSQDHAAHCHAGPSTCTGPQATIGSWWIGADANPVAPPEPSLVIEITSEANQTESPSYRLVPPPRIA